MYTHVYVNKNVNYFLCVNVRMSVSLTIHISECINEYAFALVIQ